MEKRFSCIDTPFRCSLETAQTVIVATAVLHNLALSLGDYEDDDSRPLQQDDTMVMVALCSSSLNCAIC
ncbi:hypothetical protein TNCV_1995751 [Trichonephila clavipes]|nr:hypothetical protein TNCV_1995751 [Trichonephila clavipes]